MKRVVISILLLAALCANAADPVGTATETYFAGLFAKLESVAMQKPTAENFRDVMKPVAESLDGFYDATLIDTNYVIRQTYLKRNALARGFSLRKVDQLSVFWAQMDETPAPQLSEPGHGSLLQPHLISMRYPVITNGKLESVVSLLVRTETFLEAAGLDKCRAYKIICRGQPAEEKGILSKHFRETRLQLPSTEWVIQYDP
ncbi:MAG: hypothetical protein IT583_01800 [Verrucomicrobia bacterium]|nr:hypothetical protein [Verrucomicrobiota bacterium]